MFGYKSFENVNRKQSVCTGCRARVRVLVLLFVWMEVGSIVCFVNDKKKRKKRNNHKGKQRLRKQRGRCRSRLLPGIVRRTDGGGRLRKSENITKQVRQWAEAIESIPLARLGSAHRDFLHRTRLSLPISNPVLDQMQSSMLLSMKLKTFCNLQMRNKHSFVKFCEQIKSFCIYLTVIPHQTEQRQGFPSICGFLVAWTELFCLSDNVWAEAMLWLQIPQLVTKCWWLRQQ